MGVTIRVGSMAFAFPGDGAIDYLPCRYGTSKLTFRGPGHDLAGEFIAVLGGTETYGKYIPQPYPSLLGRLAGVEVVNLGCVNAGPDAFLRDPGVLPVAARARAAVLQVMGAQNLSNRFYRVHPRRNDRFLGASSALRSMFPEVDFTEFHFTRHMLIALRAASPQRFEVVAEELRAVWVARMKLLLERLPRRVILLWLSVQPPPAPAQRADLGHDPMLVDAEMVAAIRPLASFWVEVVGGDLAADLQTMPMQPQPSVPGAQMHRAAAEALAEMLPRLL